MAVNMDDEGYGARGGALVEEAKRLMKENEEEGDQPVQNNGP
jgi:hypothetical protein